MLKINLTQKDLQRITSLHKQLQRDTEQLYLLREMAEGTGSIPTDTLYVQNSLPPSGNKFAVAAADLSEIVEEEENELRALQNQVHEFINTLEPLHNRVIHLRYIECLDWETIAGMVGYTRRHVIRLHNITISVLPLE